MAHRFPEDEMKSQWLMFDATPGYLACVVSFAILATACAPDVATRPDDAKPVSPKLATIGSADLPAMQPGDSAAADSLAYGIALAIARPDLRRMMFADLRDSPFPNHSLDLISYLQGDHAHALTATIGQALRITPQRVIDMATVRGGLELKMPIDVDRATWTGNDSIVVWGTANTMSENLHAQKQPFAYTLRDETVPVYLTRRVGFPPCRGRAENICVRR
jgi:hypothetical protein